VKEETAVSTTVNARVRVEPGIYRRGDIYEIRVGYRDATGDRHEMWIARAIVRDLFSGVALVRFLSTLMLITGLGPVLAPQIGSWTLSLTTWRGVSWSSPGSDWSCC
jgi:hypothetical protein